MLDQQPKLTETPNEPSREPALPAEDTIAARLQRWLVDPYSPLPRKEDLRRVRLFAGLLLILIAITALGRTVAPLPAWLLLELIVLYFLSRTEYFQVAAFLAVAVMLLPAYMDVLGKFPLDQDALTASFSWHLIPIVFASLLLDLRVVVFLISADLVGLLAFPFFVPGINHGEMLVSYVIVGGGSTLVLVVQHIRNLIENDRQLELRQNEARYRSLTEQLATLNEISRAVSSVQEEPKVFEAIFQQVQRIIPLDSFFISKYDPEIHTISFPFLYDNGRQWVEETITLPEDSWMAQVLRSRTPFMRNRPASGADKILTRLGFDLNRKEVASLMIVPMRLGSRIAGSITVQSHLPDAYTQEHLNLLTGIAYQAATAIENARLFDALQAEIKDLENAEVRLQRQSQHAQALAAISQLLVEDQSDSGGVEINSLLERVARMVGNVFNDLCIIRLVSEDGRFLIPIAIHGGDREAVQALRLLWGRVQQTVSEGISGEVMRTGRPMLIANFNLAEYENRLSRHLVSYLRQYPVSGVILAPLRAQGKMLGLMNVWRSDPTRPYDQEDLTFLADLADRVALGIVNARLYSELQTELVTRRNAEAEVRVLNVELEQRVRERTAQLRVAVQELESFAYSVSHDLRAPLRAINGYSTALMEDHQDILDEQGKMYLNHILSATRRMSGLIDDLLNLSRVTRSEMRLAQVDLAALAREVMNDLRRANPERKVNFSAPPQLRARADANLMRSALSNLLGNAWKFTSIHENANIELGEMEMDGERVFFVRDDGAGFDMAYIDRLFNEFQRLHSPDKFEGTGIGLVIVRRIIQRHGGRIWAEGEPDKGATFYFALGT